MLLAVISSFFKVSTWNLTNKYSRKAFGIVVHGAAFLLKRNLQSYRKILHQKL